MVAVDKTPAARARGLGERRMMAIAHVAMSALFLCDSTLVLCPCAKVKDDPVCRLDQTRELRKKPSIVAGLRVGRWGRLGQKSTTPHNRKKKANKEGKRNEERPQASLKRPLNHEKYDMRVMD